MSGFWDIIVLLIIALGIMYMISCINTLNNVRKKKIDKNEIDKAYSYMIIIAILYILFWLSLKIKQ